MEDSRKLLDHFYVCCNKMDGLYYLAARRLGVKENALVLLYTLNDGQPRSQKQLSEELLIPKTTINTIVKEYMDAGYVTLVPANHSREKNIALTPAGAAYAKEILEPVYRAEKEAMEQTLAEFSPEFMNAIEALTQNMAQAFQRTIFDRKELE